MKLIMIFAFFYIIIRMICHLYHFCALYKLLFACFFCIVQVIID